MKTIRVPVKKKKQTINGHDEAKSDGFLATHHSATMASKEKERGQDTSDTTPGTRRNLKGDTAGAKATFCSKSSKAFGARSWLCHSSELGDREQVS